MCSRLSVFISALAVSIPGELTGYDPAVAQLSISIAAIHTTSDMLTQLLLDICRQDGLIEEMRQEIRTVIGAGRQRLKPAAVVSMRRLAERSFQLSDGTRIPKDSMLVVSCERMWNETVYAAPDEFGPYRFLKLRDTAGHAPSFQVVAPSPEHMGFGFGKHARPGRFFAASEIKITLCHILLDYDLRLAQGWSDVRPMAVGLRLPADPRAQLAIRRRKR
ncbi:cytochrome P450 [Aspergillus aurantiobrunneus]